MVESLALHQPAAAQKVAPAAGVPVVQAFVDAKPDDLIVVRVLLRGWIIVVTVISINSVTITIDIATLRKQRTQQQRRCVHGTPVFQFDHTTVRLCALNDTWLSNAARP